MTPRQISDLAFPVASKFGLNQCRPCATALRAVFKEAGLHGSVLRLSTKGGRGFIVMRDIAFKLPFRTGQDEAISSTGQHFGVLVGNYVFDNVFRSGILHMKWQKQFDCDVHAFAVHRIEPF